jgi:hypothetical protein
VVDAAPVSTLCRANSTPVDQSASTATSPIIVSRPCCTCTCVTPYTPMHHPHNSHPNCVDTSPQQPIHADTLPSSQPPTPITHTNASPMHHHRKNRLESVPNTNTTTQPIHTDTPTPAPTTNSLGCAESQISADATWLL